MLLARWALLTLLFAPTIDPLVTVNPAFVMAGQGLRVTCKVPRREMNRWVTVGVNDLTSSTRQLEGIDGAITHDLLIERMPCHVGPAFCIVIDRLGSPHIASHPFTILGCN